MLPSKVFSNSYRKSALLAAGILLVGWAVFSNSFKGGLESKFVISDTHYRKSKNSLSEVSGRITNKHFLSHDVTLRVIFYGRDGGRLGVEDSLVRDVKAKATEPFRVFTTDDINGFTRYQLKILSVR